VLGHFLAVQPQNDAETIDSSVELIGLERLPCAPQHIAESVVPFAEDQVALHLEGELAATSDHENVIQRKAAMKRLRTDLARDRIGGESARRGLDERAAEVVREHASLEISAATAGAVR
jgi:hypothetical protein